MKLRRRASGLQDKFELQKIHHTASKIVFEFSAENVFQRKDALRLIYRIMLLFEGAFLSACFLAQGLAPVFTANGCCRLNS